MDKTLKVSNNIEKGETYKGQIERFNLSRDQGFYYEGIFILYAMMEDRLSSFLFYAGVTSNDREKITSNDEVRGQINQIINPDGKKHINLRNISSKIIITNKLLNWADNHHPDSLQRDYKDVLAARIAKIPRHKEILTLLEGILDWCNARNELVHALLNRKLENQESQLKILVDKGFAYTRQLDKFVTDFKTHNIDPIRKKFDIQ